MKKNPIMFSTMIFCWLCVAFYLSPRILALVVGPENIFAKIAVVCFSILLNIFWFYAFYHLVIILFSYVKLPFNYNIGGQNKEKTPSVALLYATCNDFKEEAVLSCLGQNYGNYHTFILDDSNSEEYKGRIDRFASGYPQTISVIRRRERRGYKAGNINYGLAKIGDFEYFSVSDADTILPADYIIKLLPYFKDSHLAYVQSRQELNPNQKSAFAQELGFQISLHCDHYLITKNRYGFVMFYGHGALMRTDVWREVGGFPEVATEDLSYSMKVRERGYFGIYVPEVVCFEDYPPTYQQYRKRNEKWIRGTAESLFKYYPSFLRCRQIGWIEKFDVLSSALSLLLALPFFILLLLVGIILPFFFTHFRFQGPMFRMPLVYDNSLINLAVGIKGNFFWTWDFFLMLLLALASPILPAIMQVLQKPKKRLRYIVMYTFVFYAMQLVSSLNLVSYLLSRKANFPVTGEEGGKEETLPGSLSGGLKENLWQFLSSPTANQRPTLFTEVVFAVIFLSISLATNNIWFLSFASGLVISVLLFNFGFENKLLKYLVGIPLIITTIIVLLIGRTLQ